MLKKVRCLLIVLKPVLQHSVAEAEKAAENHKFNASLSAVSIINNTKFRSCNQGLNGKFSSCNKH